MLFLGESYRRNLLADSRDLLSASPRSSILPIEKFVLQVLDLYGIFDDSIGGIFCR